MLGVAVAADPDQWLLVMTQPRAEQRVSERLSELGYPNLLFRHRQTIIRQGRRIEQLVPAWPRYLLVAAAGMAWDAILAVPRVSDFVRVGIAPATLSAALVSQYRAKADGDLVLPLPARPSRFRFGDRVMIQGHSVVAGHLAIYQYLLDGQPDIACVLQQWLGQMVFLQVAESDLVPMSEFKRTRRRMQRERRRRQRGHYRTRQYAAESSLAA